MLSRGGFAAPENERDLVAASRRHLTKKAQDAHATCPEQAACRSGDNLDLCKIVASPILDVKLIEHSSAALKKDRAGVTDFINHELWALLPPII